MGPDEIAAALAQLNQQRADNAARIAALSASLPAQARNLTPQQIRRAPLIRNEFADIAQQIQDLQREQQRLTAAAADLSAAANTPSQSVVPGRSGSGGPSAPGGEPMPMRMWSRDP